MTATVWRKVLHRFIVVIEFLALIAVVSGVDILP